MDRIISDYIAKAIELVTVEEMEDGEYFANIPGFQGVWGAGPTEEIARSEVAEVLEEWLILKLRDDDDDLPVLDGLHLNIGGKRWAQPRAASSSGN